VPCPPVKRAATEEQRHLEGEEDMFVFTFFEDVIQVRNGVEIPFRSEILETFFTSSIDIRHCVCRRERDGMKEREIGLFSINFPIFSSLFAPLVFDDRHQQKKKPLMEFSNINEK
jgi:hypothetical protein